MKLGNKEWSDSGYVLSERYERHVIHYQDPIRLTYAVASQNQSAPDPKKNFSYLDIGCGEGVTLTCLADAYPHARFTGIDFNLTHIQNAKTLASRSGVKNVEFIHVSFDDFMEQAEPKFDFVVAHGIISWVSHEDKEKTFDLANKCLSDRGIFYFCYYTRPGAIWADITHRLAHCIMQRSPCRNLTEEITKTLGVLEDLGREKGSRLFKASEQLLTTIRSYSDSSPYFNIHEIGNKNLQSFFFSDIRDALAGRGLGYVASAELSKNVLKHWMVEKDYERGKQMAPDVVQSFASLQSFESFRWDIFKRNTIPTSAHAGCIDRIEDFYFVSMRSPYRFPDRVYLQDKYILFDEDAYRKVLELARDGQRTIGEIAAHKDLAKCDTDDVAEILRSLVSSGLFRVALSPTHLDAAKDKTRYQLTTKVPLELYDRDFPDTGGIYVPSAKLGCINYVFGFNAVALIAMNGLDFSTAKYKIQAMLKRLPRHVLQSNKMEAYLTEDGYRAAILHFRFSVLPNLIKAGVLKPIDQMPGLTGSVEQSL